MKEEQLGIYGQVLTGNENKLDKTKMLRIQYLKTKLRRLLDYTNLGDTKDLLTDLAKTVVLGWAIQQGIVTDKATMDRFKALVAGQLEFYGGPEFILEVLEENANKLSDLMARYYQAKDTILKAEDEEGVQGVDIEDMGENRFLPER